MSELAHDDRVDLRILPVRLPPYLLRIQRVGVLEHRVHIRTPKYLERPVVVYAQSEGPIEHPPERGIGEPFDEEYGKGDLQIRVVDLIGKKVFEKMVRALYLVSNIRPVFSQHLRNDLSQHLSTDLHPMVVVSLAREFGREYGL